MNARLSSLLASLALAAVAAPAGAITFGAPDGNAHPHVGAILFERPDGYYSCTGTMMSPTLMITAGHCTSEGGVPNVRSWVTFRTDVSIQSECSTRKCLNKFLDNPKNGWIPGTAHPHPSYADFASYASFDIGVIELDRAVSLPVYGELPSLGFLETVHSDAENRFTAVGYGMQGLVQPFYSDLWTRYAGTVKLMEVDSTWNAGQSAKYTNNPGTGGGTCFGDSGGPIFYADTNIVVSVVSWGLTPCIGADYNFRTDIPEAQDFVDSYLE